MGTTPDEIAHLRRAFETFDVEALRAGALNDWFEEFYDDEATVEHAEAFPVPDKRHIDRDGYAQYFEDTYGAYADVRWHIEEMRPIGDRVLVIGRIGGHVHDDPTPLEIRLALLYRLNHGRIAEVQGFTPPRRAIEAAGAPAAPPATG